MGNPKLVMRKQRQLKDGSYPIVLQLYIKRQKVAITLDGMAIEEKHWDEDKQQVRKSFADYKDRNLQLQSYVAKAVDILKEYRLADIEMTATAFRREFRNDASRLDFLQFMQAKIDNEFARHIISPATKRIHENCLEKLKAYQGKVMFAEISREWIEGFDAWHAKLQGSKGYEGLRAREKAFKSIRKYLKMAKADGKKFKDPFHGLVWPRSKSRPVFLSQDELQQLLYLYRNPDMIERACIAYIRLKELNDVHRDQFLQYAPERLQKTLRSFLWQCFTGMRYDDMHIIRHRDIERDRGKSYLVFVPQKTENTSGVEVRMPITPIMEELIVSRVGLLVETPSNQKYNQRLKEVAEIFGIKKRLTTHVGRHTFATTSLARGMSIEVLMELMGLTKLDTLMIYVHITEKRKEKEMNDTWAGI